MVAVSIDAIDALGTDDRVLQTATGENLRTHSQLSPLGGDGTVIQPSQSSLVFMDVVLPEGAELPEVIGHVFRATLSAPEAGGAASFGGGLTIESGGVQGVITFRAADVGVDRAAAAVISSPVRGKNWVIFRGCCDLLNSHRGTVSFAGGSLQIGERFGIDFVQTNDDGMMISGPGNELASYVYVGADILAVADGTVVAARNTEPNQTPGAFPLGLDDAQAGGNMVVLDIGNGHYVFYAHMQPGSVTVEAGDVVNAGEVIGQLGNSGRTIGPHLHFHVMDNPDWQLGNGVPYVFDAFIGQGVLPDGAMMKALQGQPVTIDAGQLSGPHSNQHPLNNEVIDFGN
jgi:murein DD-endopeptidase MepM/ murein hydrolase activator NlpD